MVRVTAANLLTGQPLFIEMECGGFGYGINAPPDTAIKLVSLLSIRGKLRN
jgi:hypothetical protein